MKFKVEEKIRFIRFRPDLFNWYYNQDKTHGRARLYLAKENDYMDKTDKFFGAYEFVIKNKTYFVSIIGAYAHLDIMTDYAIWVYYGSHLVNGDRNRYSLNKFCLNFRKDNNLLIRSIRLAHEAGKYEEAGKLIASVIGISVKGGFFNYD